MGRYEAGSTLIPSTTKSITEHSVKTKPTDILRSMREDSGTPDIMAGKGNEFTAEVISIMNENGTMELKNQPSFQARAGHESAALGRVMIRIRPLEDWPTHIMLPEVARAGGAKRKGHFNVWEQMYPVATALAPDLPAPPIGSKVRIRVDGLGANESFWYVAVLDDKVTAPFIEPDTTAKSAFAPCPPGFHCKPPTGDPINTEGSPWGYAAVSASPQSGLLQKAIVNCAKYKSYQLPEGKGIYVEQFITSADAKYTGMSSPKDMRKQIQKHGFTYVILGVAFYGSSLETIAETSFLEPYIEELLAHRIRPFLLGELFGGGADTKSATMVDGLTDLLNDLGAAGIITRMRSLGPNNSGWSAESATQHAEDLMAASAEYNMSIGFLGPGHPNAFPELAEPIENIASAVDYVMAEISPNQSLTSVTAIQAVLDQASVQWGSLGYEMVFPVYPVYGNGFTKVPTTPEKTNFAPGQSMPSDYFAAFATIAGMTEQSTADNDISTLAINDWANLDVGESGAWTSYGWSSSRWDTIKTIPVTDMYPKTEQEARERNLPAYLSTDGPLVFLPPVKPVNSPTGFSRPAAILTGSQQLEFKGPVPPPGETYSQEPGQAEPVDDTGSTPAAATPATDNQQEAGPVDELNPPPGSTPNDVSQIGSVEGGTSCQSAWANQNNYLWPDISDLKKLGRFTMPEGGRGTIRPVPGSTIGIPGKPGPFSVYSNTRLPPQITEWPTKNGKAPGANAFGEQHYWSGSPGINRKPGDRNWGGLSKWSRQNIISHRQVQKRLNKNSPTKKKSEATSGTENPTQDLEGTKSNYANPCEMYGGVKVGRANANYLHEFRTIFEVACRVSGYTPGNYVSTKQYKNVKYIGAYVPKGKLSGGRFFAFRSHMYKYNKMKWNHVPSSQTLEEAYSDAGWKFPKSGVLKLSKQNTVGEFFNKFEAARQAYAMEMYKGTNSDGSLNPKRFGFAFSMHATGCAFDIAPSENWLGSSASKKLHFKFKNPIIWEMTGGYLAKAEYYYHKESKYHDTYGSKKEYIKKGGAGKGKYARLGLNTKGSNIFKVVTYKGGGYKSKDKNLLKEVLEGASSAPSYEEFVTGVKAGGPYAENLQQKLNEWSLESGKGYVFFSSKMNPSDIYVVKRSIPLSAVRMHPAFWQTFIRAGWSWGGAWTSCFKDDHHFSRKQLFGHQARAVAGRGPHAEGGYPFVNDRGACDYKPVPFKDLKNPSVMINPTKTLLPIKNGKAWHPSYEPNYDNEYIYIHGIGNFPRDPNSPLMVSGIGKSKSSNNPIDPANYPNVDFT